MKIPMRIVIAACVLILGALYVACSAYAEPVRGDPGFNQADWQQRVHHHREWREFYAWRSEVHWEREGERWAFLPDHLKHNIIEHEWYTMRTSWEE